MPGGNPSKHPHSSLSAAQAHHRNSRYGSSSSSAVAATATATATAIAASVDHRTSGDSKSKPSSNPSTTRIPTPTNKDSSNKSSTQQPNLRRDNPSSLSENANSLPGLRPVFPLNDPPPLPSYGFHMLDRRSIVLVDGSVRSYFALPPDYQNFTPMPRLGFRPEIRGPTREFGLERPPFPISPEFIGSHARSRNLEYWNPGPENLLKRKYGEDDRGAGRDDGFERQRQQLLQYGNVNGPGSSSGHNLGRGEETRASKTMRIFEGIVKLKHNEIDQIVLKKAFFHFLKLIFETTNHKKNFLADGRQGLLRCLACSRSTKDFPDTHSLIMHAYNSDSADSTVDHLAFHKALCVLMGWNFLIPPDNSKAYQNLSSDDAEAHQDDLIMWPPSVLIHNTVTGKVRDGRVEGLGNKAMDSILRDLGFPTGKSISLHSREGHLGIHLVKFSSDESGLKEAERLAAYFEREKRGRKAWGQMKPLTLGKDDESNPNLMKPDPKTEEKKRALYGHLATVADLDKVTFEIKKKTTIVSKRDFKTSK